MPQSVSIKAFDIFCGIGGLSYGLQMAGIPVVAGLDSDLTCRYAYEENCKAKFIHTDIRNFNYSDISPWFKGVKYRVLVGCAPCQPFSAHSAKIGIARKDDTRWNLIHEFLRFIDDGKPEIASMENVPRLRKEDVYLTFKDSLRQLGYQVVDGIVECEYFGVPQKRRRLVLLASRLDDISLPEKNLSKPITVRDSIGHLNHLNNGKASTVDPIHVCRNLSPLNLKRIQASVPAGTWRDWPEDLLLECHKKSSGKTYSCVYGRMSWEKPSPTITTQFYSYGTGRFGHPEQDRALSIREGAILQSFPEDYKFIHSNKPGSISELARHIGNAVPPLLGKAIGTSIVSHINRFEDNI
ncbi:MAG: DNA cytosine methyltransferase [Bacteroidetes bacterium]|nr:DNA cytosine methyltransferase [Bacteroidota bacterium]MCY4233343.1 DNA cytosine methyltransferase [Bacteroidota bacterium]